jgi:hypothetical protein
VFCTLPNLQELVFVMWGIPAVAIQFNASPVIHRAPPAKELLLMTVQPVKLTLPCLRDPLWGLVHVTKDFISLRMGLVERVIFPARVVLGQLRPNVRAAIRESLMGQDDVNVLMEST